MGGGGGGGGLVESVAGQTLLVGRVVHLVFDAVQRRHRPQAHHRVPEVAARLAR